MLRLLNIYGAKLHSWELAATALGLYPNVSHAGRHRKNAGQMAGFCDG
jgi:hypothetical protein